jgi:hypothetical protein
MIRCYKYRLPANFVTYTGWTKSLSAPEDYNIEKGKGKDRFSGFIRHWGFFMQAYCTLAPRNFLPSPLEALCISQTQRTLLAKEVTNGIWPAISQFPKRAGFFYMPQIWDMGQIISLPLRRKACCVTRRFLSQGTVQSPVSRNLSVIMDSRLGLVVSGQLGLYWWCYGCANQLRSGSVSSFNYTLKYYRQTW